MRIDVVIPVYKPDRRLLKIVEKLSAQTFKIERIHLVNTQKQYFESFLGTLGYDEETFLQRYPLVDITHIQKKAFDHGATRNLGAGFCKGADFMIMMTQDAVPKGKTLAQRLVEPFAEDEKIAVSYARQVPYRNASMAERISREFNYPSKSMVKSEEDFGKLGIKTYFCSNVCAAYRMDIFEKLGGFFEPMIFNEDMVFAGYALKAGYRIRYSAEAKVFHSHNYGPLQQFHRNFDLGVSQAQHPEIFGRAHSEGEGVKYVKKVLFGLKKERKAGEIPEFVLCCGFRYLGFLLGKKYEKLPRAWVLAFTSNREFWDWEKNNKKTK